MQHGGFSVTSLLQTVLDCIVRLELPEAVAVADAALGAHGKPQALTRMDINDAAARLPSGDAEGFIGRTDFFWPELGVIGEFDGDAKYLDENLLGGQSTQEAVLAEKKREDRLRALLRQKLAGAGVLPQESPSRGLVPQA